MKYTPERVALICDLIAAGEHTIADICLQADITRTTFFEWKAEKADFSDSLKKAESQRLDSLQGRAVSGLAKLLDIHTVEETQTEYVDKNGAPVIKSRKVTKRVFMPSAAAVIYTLNNRDPQNWQQRKHVELSGTIAPARPDLSQLSREELRLYVELSRKTLPASPDAELTADA